MPESIDCGCCLAGGVRKIVLQVDNTGGEGRFSIRHPLKEDQVSKYQVVSYQGIATLDTASV